MNRKSASEELNGSTIGHHQHRNSPNTFISTGRCFRCARSSRRYSTSGGSSDCETAFALMGVADTASASLGSVLSMFGGQCVGRL